MLLQGLAPLLRSSFLMLVSFLECYPNVIYRERNVTKYAGVLKSF
jgi:hypothetical protein